MKFRIYNLHQVQEGALELPQERAERLAGPAWGWSVIALGEQSSDTHYYYSGTAESESAAILAAESFIAGWEACSDEYDIDED